MFRQAGSKVRNPKVPRDGTHCFTEKTREIDSPPIQLPKYRVRLAWDQEEAERDWPVGRDTFVSLGCRPTKVSDHPSRRRPGHGTRMGRDNISIGGTGHIADRGGTGPR
jgi:hypothetical protein